VRLIRGLLKAGYEDWVFHKTYSGTPQGGVVSPMLANIYLHELDMFMAKMAGFDKGSSDHHP
jgi:RNA-directed DNA polymerase